MSRMQRLVTEFHNALEVPVRDIPTALETGERKLRANLIWEETLEVLQSLGFAPLEDGNSSLEMLNYPEPVHKQIKELCDLLYVVFGTAATMGVDLGEFFEMVHENNMTKAGGEIRSDGKRLKPADYKQVNLAPLLARILESKCRTCDENDGTGPSHFASPACQSGGYPHCTCDTCF